VLQLKLIYEENISQELDLILKEAEVEAEEHDNYFVH
jgi:hypothetical protein